MSLHSQEEGAGQDTVRDQFKKRALTLVMPKNLKVNAIKLQYLSFSLNPCHSFSALYVAQASQPGFVSILILHRHFTNTINLRLVIYPAIVQVIETGNWTRPFVMCPVWILSLIVLVAADRMDLEDWKLKLHSSSIDSLSSLEMAPSTSNSQDCPRILGALC